MIPKYVAEELESARKFFDANKKCIFCSMIESEQAQKARVVVENEDFIVFCPFAPRYPFECWIFPKKHSSQFAFLHDREHYNLAHILRDVMSRLKVCLDDPSYNYYFHIPPANSQNHAESFHWHIEIAPKLTSPSGFEWGTGFYDVPISPETAAKYLRG